MSEAIRHFLYGAGTILQLMPSSRNNAIKRPDFMRVKANSRIESDWQRVGLHLRRAMAAERTISTDGSAK